jgi:hypothetical protein
MIAPAPFDPGAIGARSTPKQVEWTSRDCMLYALGVGMGVDDLAFTTSNTKGIEQRMVPTTPVTLGVDFSVLKAAGPFDWAKVLHAEQRVELLATIPVKGRAEAVTEITEMWDKGKAALIVAETTGTSLDGEPLWRSSAGLFIRGAGGWGGERSPASAGVAAARRGDLDSVKTVRYQTSRDQALIYPCRGTTTRFTPTRLSRHGRGWTALSCTDCAPLASPPVRHSTSPASAPFSHRCRRGLPGRCGPGISSRSTCTSPTPQR